VALTMRCRQVWGEGVSLPMASLGRFLGGYVLVQLLMQEEEPLGSTRVPLANIGREHWYPLLRAPRGKGLPRAMYHRTSVEGSRSPWGPRAFHWRISGASIGTPFSGLPGVSAATCYM
jgi:hypothetical protein